MRWALLWSRKRDETGFKDEGVNTGSRFCCAKREGSQSPRDLCSRRGASYRRTCILPFGPSRSGKATAVTGCSRVHTRMPEPGSVREAGCGHERICCQDAAERPICLSVFMASPVLGHCFQLLSLLRPVMVSLGFAGGRSVCCKTGILVSGTSDCAAFSMEFLLTSMWDLRCLEEPID